MRIARTLALIAITAATPAAARAQTHATDRGSILVGGQASFNSTKSEDDDGENPRYNSLSIRPRALFFVSPGVALGGQMIFGYSSTGGNSSTTWGVGPEAAYYFGSAAATVHPYVTVIAQYVHNSNGATTRARAFGGGAGLLFLISSAVGIDAQAYIRRDHSTFEGVPVDIDFDQTTYGLSFGISAFVF